jgi:hypothetical protein
VPAGRGLDPWIPLAVAPAPAQRPLDVLTQMYLLQQLGGERRPRQPKAAPIVRTPPPPPPAASGENWMSAYIKPAKP